MVNSNTYSQQQIKEPVGYGFSLPSKPSSFNQRIFYLFKFLFVGRLKPYPTEFCDINLGERGRSHVGRVALIPTLIYLLKYMVVQWKFLCQLLINMKHLFYACLCRDEGNPTYGFFKLYHFNLSPFGFDGVVRGLHPTKLYFLPILFCGALENSTLHNPNYNTL